ncbi:MAG: hypothetical protein GY755_06535, partial [Chloroflexi bacterium]|nr:hypothetical protein [Chloroflexota bacterium]
HNNTKFLQPNPNQYQQLNNYLHHNYNSDNNNNSNTNNPTHITNTLTNSNMIINQKLASQCSKSTNKYFKSKNKLTYTPKSVLYRAKQIITDLKENNVFNIISNPIRQPISALPIYMIKKVQSNFIIKTDEQHPMNYMEYELYYSDGSCFPNPGIGAYGWYGPYPSTKRTIPFHIKSVNYMTTAAMCELKAVQLFLEDIINNRIAPLCENIVIFIDCIGVLNYLNFTSYPKYEVYKTEVEKIFQSLNQLYYTHPTLKIHFYKIKAHIGIKGNTAIDTLVYNKAKNLALKNNANNIIPLIKDYPTALAQLYKQIKIKHQSKWENRKNQQTLVFKNNKKWNHKLT